MTTINRVTAAAILTVGLAMSGCQNADGERTQVSGTVSFDGQPVAKGRIYFNPVVEANAEGLQGFAEIMDGKYDTRLKTGMGPSSGKVQLKIEGFGDPTESYPNGTPLFVDFIDPEPFEVPSRGLATRNVDVPRSAFLKLPAKPLPPP